MKGLILLIVVVAAFCCVAAKRTEKEYVNAWLDFTSKYQKTYAHDVVHYRYRMFKQNLDFIDSHNARTDVTFQVAINTYADLSGDEFSRYFLGTRFEVDAQTEKKSETVRIAKPSLPASWDWRTKNAVTPIKNQQQCGSCWAFSTTGSVEGCTAIATGQLIGLSEQDLVDCSSDQGNEGCDGGLMDNAFQYIIANDGIETEAAYPYTAETGNTCLYNSSDCGAQITGYTDVSSGDENGLQAACYIQPISVAMDASQSSFQFYASGVYSDPNCSSTSLDHGVLAIGWGVSSTTPYWIVKNSWGTDWGIQGFFWLLRGQNECGIATMASYPTGCSQCKSN